MYSVCLTTVPTITCKTFLVDKDLKWSRLTVSVIEKQRNSVVFFNVPENCWCLVVPLNQKQLAKEHFGTTSAQNEMYG